ncbi:MAG TPA: hypothetical protein VIJ94_18320 [Caulobacteraceae bacterium]
MRTLAGVGVVLAAVAVLAACTHPQGLLSFSPQYRFGYDDKGTSAALAYGMPNSDDVALMLECPKGTGRIELTDTEHGEATTAIMLTSDGRKTRVPVHFEDVQDASNDPQVMVGHLPASAAALQALRRSGVIEVSNGAKAYSITVAPGERAGVERFFRECG